MIEDDFISTYHKGYPWNLVTSWQVNKPTKVGSFYPILANQLWIYEH